RRPPSRCRSRRARVAWSYGGCTCRRSDASPAARSRRRSSCASCHSPRARSACVHPSLPGAGAAAPRDPAPGLPAPGLPAPAFPAPGLPAPGLPAPAFPAPGFPALWPFVRSRLLASAACRLRLALHGLQARDVAPHFAELIGLGRLPGGALHSQGKLLLAQLDELIGELGRGFAA